MSFGPGSNGRVIVALAAIAMLALLVRLTMEPGRFQQVTWLLLGFFAFRIVVGWRRSR